MSCAVSKRFLLGKKRDTLSQILKNGSTPSLDQDSTMRIDLSVQSLQSRASNSNVISIMDWEQQDYDMYVVLNPAGGHVT